MQIFQLEDNARCQLDIARRVDGSAWQSERAVVVGLQVRDAERVFVEGIQQFRLEAERIALINRELLDDAQVIVEVCRRAHFAGGAREAGCGMSMADRGHRCSSIASPKCSRGCSCCSRS